MSEMKPMWHTVNEVPKEGDFIAFLTPSGNLLTGNFEGKTDWGFFVIKNRAFEYATMDVVSKWAYVDELIATDALRARIEELEEALKENIAEICAGCLDFQDGDCREIDGNCSYQPALKKFMKILKGAGK